MGKKALRFGKRVLISLSIPFVLLLILFVFAGDSVSGSSILLWMQLAIPPAILAWGVCFSLKVGMWDFSVGGVIFLAGIIGGNIAKASGMEVLGVILLCPLCGALLGLVTGSIFRWVKIPSIVASVGALLLYECATEFVFHGDGVLLSDKIYVIYTFPYNVIIGVAAFGIIYFIYNFTKFGYHVRAVGNGIHAAKMAGINVDRVRWICFILGGMFAGLYAVMTLGSAGVMVPIKNMSSMSLVFDGIICVFIALALESQCNLIIGVYIGAFVAQIIKGGILAIGFPTMYQQCVVAVLLLIFMSANTEGRELLHKLKLRLHRAKTV